MSSNGLTGLAQLNDQMGDRCPHIVMIADDEAVTIAVQAIKQGAEDQKSKRSAERFRTSVENVIGCFGIYSAIRDQTGQIIDFHIDYLNGAALESSCLTLDDIGKSLCDVLPN